LGIEVHIVVGREMGIRIAWALELPSALAFAWASSLVVELHNRIVVDIVEYIAVGRMGRIVAFVVQVA